LPEGTFRTDRRGCIRSIPPPTARGALRHAKSGKSILLMLVRTAGLFVPLERGLSSDPLLFLTKDSTNQYVTG
jgi:hypothetical protein